MHTKRNTLFCMKCTSLTFKITPRPVYYMSSAKKKVFDFHNVTRQNMSRINFCVCVQERRAAAHLARMNYLFKETVNGLRVFTSECVCVRMFFFFLLCVLYLHLARVWNVLCRRIAGGPARCQGVVPLAARWQGLSRRTVLPVQIVEPVNASKPRFAPHGEESASITVNAI